MRGSVIAVLLGFGLVASACDKAEPNAVAPAKPARCGDFDPTSSKIPDDWLMCQTDADCTRAHTNCCNCNNGSNGVAIATSFAACVTPECPEKTTCPQSVECQDRVVCNEGMCGLAPATAPAAPAPPPTDANGCGEYVAGSNEVPVALLDCSSDDDCTLAQNTCCPCSANGNRVAVAKAHASCIAPPVDCPEHPVCSDAYVCDDHEVECRQGTCIRVDLRKLLVDPYGGQ